MTPDTPWSGDVNEAVVEEWKAETSPFDRVREVLTATTSFQYAGEIADRAHVSEPSARKHLKALADAGFAETETAGKGTRFKRSREFVAMRRMRELHSELSREELVSGIRDLKSRIQSYQEQYDVTDPDALALELDADDDGWADISEWRALDENLDLAQAALSLYDFDPDRESGEKREDSSEGAFARERGGLSA